MIDKMNRIIEDKEREERKESIVIREIKTREKIGAEWVRKENIVFFRQLHYAGEEDRAGFLDWLKRFLQSAVKSVQIVLSDIQ